ncbi:MAG: hypothetical protein ACRD22_05810 [Terriglobia bacterium]
MSDVKEYSGVTERGLENLRRDLQSIGITPPQENSGTIEYQGVKLAINYGPADQKLTVRILEKPAFIPESLVWQMLDGRIQKCLA